MPSSNDPFHPVLEALGEALGDSSARRYAEGEARAITARLAAVTEMLQAGELSVAEARALIGMQGQATQALLLTVKGMDLITAQNAVNAAIAAGLAALGKAAGMLL